MSVHEVTMYEIVCDEPGCGFKTHDLGGEFSAWGDRGAARDEWVDGDQQEVEVAGVTMHFCEKHEIPRCVACEETADLVLDESGERYCPRCLAIAFPPQAEQFDLTGPRDPDCRGGKHTACSGRAWDDDADALTVCACLCHGGVTA